MATSLIRSKKYSVVTGTSKIVEVPDVTSYIVSVPAGTSCDIQYSMENIIIANPSDAGTLTFVVTANTLTRTKGSWIDDNFVTGMTLSIAGTASNNGTAYVIGTVTASTITLSSGSFANETIVSTLAMATAIYDAAAVWFTMFTVGASSHRYDAVEFGPKGMRFVVTGTGPVVVWVKG